jgi:hypothetical protein
MLSEVDFDDFKRTRWIFGERTEVAMVDCPLGNVHFPSTSVPRIFSTDPERANFMSESRIHNCGDRV